MKKTIFKVVGIAVLAISMMFVFAGCDDDTVTYYRDTNGNGECDWGEAVYSEDSNGNTTFY